jgi:ABC-type multidrug transport system ATPase subunit
MMRRNRVLSNLDERRFAMIRLVKNMTIVEIENVTKTFGQHVAVNRLSLSVPRGSIYGFIGPNGSGKTTTLRMIMRIYHPDPGPGIIRVLGEANSAAANDRVGTCRKSEVYTKK